MSWKLWIDDQIDDPDAPERWVPPGFKGASSSKEACKLVIRYGLPAYMDLDHDLKGNDTTMKFLYWLADNYPNGPIPKYNVHSLNPVGRANMILFMRDWEKYLRGK